MKINSAYVAMWLAATGVAVLMALLIGSSAYVDGEYIPVGNDSFYHARRILDAAIGERGFYQFDDMIHVPEGSWLNWPWGYDYLMAMALSFALWVRPSLEPMAFLAYVPVAWLFVNMGLLVLIARRIGIQPGATAVGLLAFALLPLTQTLHGVGIIDHHYIELTFVLASLWAGSGFFATHATRRDAIILGIVLGTAPAFHNGLFILQIPALACLFVLWLQKRDINSRNVYSFSAALIGSTIIVSLPSATFRDLQFEFWTQSWFHLYIAFCTCVVAIFFAVRPLQKQNAGLLGALAIALIVPIFAKLLTGAAFLSGDLILLDTIGEVESPITKLLDINGLGWVTSFYSWLVFLTPVLIVVYAIRIWREKNPLAVYFSVFVVFGLALLLVQYRLHPFGAWAFIFASILLVQEKIERYEISPLATTAGLLLIMALAFQPPLKNRLIRMYPPGTNVYYAASRSVFKSFEEACKEKPGVSISYSDDGHPIRYHTDCSVMTNNFLMTPLHEKKILEVDEMLALDPEQFLEQVSGVDYIFVRLYQIFEAGPDGLIPTPVGFVAAQNAPLFVGLTFADELPKEYQLIDEVRVDDERDFAYARLFRIVRDDQDL